MPYKHTNMKIQEKDDRRRKLSTDDKIKIREEYMEGFLSQREHRRYKQILKLSGKLITKEIKNG